MKDNVYEVDKNKILLPYVLLMVCAFCNDTLLDYVRVIVMKLPVISPLSNFVKPGVYFLLILWMFPFIKSKLRFCRLSYLVVPFFFFFSVFITVIFYPQNWQYIAEVFWDDIAPCFPFFILGIIFEADEDLMKVMGKASCLAIVLNTIYVFYFLSSREYTDGYSMSRAYEILPNAMFAIWYAVRYKKLISIICSITGFLYVISMGTRGPILILVIYFVLVAVILKPEIGYKKILLISSLSVALVVFLQSNLYLNTLNSLSQMLGQMGLSTRILDSIQLGTFSQSKGRSEIYEEVIRRIQQRPILGYGVYGEWCWGFRSAHNMYLELMVHFGVPLGIALLICGLNLVRRAYFRNNNYYAKSLILLWATFVLVQGFFGGSYLRFSVFFLIGFCLKELHRISEEYSIC